MILELHLLQSFPVSNLNRDDVGQPKTATFGGHTRGRISSQSLKRSARLLFNEHGLDKSETGVRTKRLVENTATALARAGRDRDTAPGVVVVALETLGFGVDPSKGLTQYLLFVGREAIDRLTVYCQNNWDALEAKATAKAAAEKAAKEAAAKAAGKDTAKGGTTPAKPAKQVKIKPDKATIEEAKRILNAERAADVALFGRMIADNKDFNVNAASQVAHAISTHAVINEFDFYTAVDDLKPDAESGADMIGTVDFNSACYYRYANLDLAQLVHNLGGDTDLADRATHAWLHSFIHAVPSGKQNSMAARTMPDTLLGVVREAGAWNLANAFLKPVTDTDLMAASSERLTRHFGQLRDFYGDSQLRAVAGASVSGDLPHLTASDTVSGLDQFTGRLLTAVKA
ncbi:type I-E CRISPR-associated protein Cas7/Cse4/CasC [Solihabitans fulvus]|uniref:Type I-E CRISPR-associated protein Cas7/Cse4/CasC n=1 Tax=Solihabitans fulvus TaxID=1892852 RepID=A0A5B2W404_9PSEU|nr:type I-E CRISPR-associated protein Cas7/Cse4/CasC [Solihabitans fulvus]KAA2246401.1 type I-E CRISPR-associated protein Cas7/Cse4/CasC [Solihabitans fulvus]